MVHNVVILAVPGVQLLDVAGPLDAFAEANRILHRQVYQPRVMSLAGREIVASSGVRLSADCQLDTPVPEGAMSFLIAGAPDAENFSLNAIQLAAITPLCLHSQRFGSVCTGALLLAQTGLLDHRRVTTHWSVAKTLTQRYPAIALDADALYVADGPLRTAAGVTSGMDLALRFIEEDVGREVALDVAANLVMFFRRPAGQGHFVRKQQTSLDGRSALQDLQRWTLSHLATVKSVAQMAAHIQLSTRHLNRLFHQEMGVSSGEWLEESRITLARELLTANHPVKSIAALCGYSSSDVMRRAFIKVTGLTPAVYRKIYAGPEPVADSQ
ncbi:GlxA family transcriptional regulator [Pantoea phytobeneficialis]|uniref:AraC family transcriptional regulator n=1 Tax=Pantoea phytobeneficialis TaxID=2052056 RepID=A0AAP9H9U6_9GAMM|nr:helix-turn-helix domain-containing protein [Pantoea phytobeneficialis]MDO6407134.1 helix-turn-helix domain-containing protein [Pantoea phytobeneficialis]QGR09107.1 AraC family transcriptional regulator [Pantoea phytobeneficialis]